MDRSGTKGGLFNREKRIVLRLLLDEERGFLFFLKDPWMPDTVPSALYPGGRVDLREKPDGKAAYWHWHLGELIDLMLNGGHPSWSEIEADIPTEWLESLPQNYNSVLSFSGCGRHCVARILAWAEGVLNGRRTR